MKKKLLMYMLIRLMLCVVNSTWRVEMHQSSKWRQCVKHAPVNGCIVT